VPYPGELRRLSRRLPCQRTGDPAAGPGRGHGATIHRERPTSHGLDFSELHFEPASAPELQRLPRPSRLSVLSPAGCSRHHPRLPSCGVPHQSPCRGLQQGELLRRLPQPGTVLCQLPPESRPGLARPASRPRVSRREAILPAESRSGGTPESGELRLLPFGARLPHLPLGRGRPAVQPARPRLRSGDLAAQESVDVHRLPRGGYSGALTQPSHTSAGGHEPDRLPGELAHRVGAQMRGTEDGPRHCCARSRREIRVGGGHDPNGVRLNPP